MQGHMERLVLAASHFHTHEAWAPAPNAAVRREIEW